jgi:hypothetical protein
MIFEGPASESQEIPKMTDVGNNELLSTAIFSQCFSQLKTHQSIIKKILS